MTKFSIPTEVCLILRALHETDSLREASTLLEMDPGQLTRKIQSFPLERGLVFKMGNRWVLTDTGKRLARWVDECVIAQKVLLEEKPTMTIACYTWLAEELLIPGFKDLDALTKHKLGWAFNVVSSSLEHEIISGRAEFAITCHSPNDPLIAHKKFSPDPWLIVAPASWKKDLKKLTGESLLKYLNSRPYVRLSTTDPEHLLGFDPGSYLDLQVNGVIGVRSAVIHGLGWSCLPSYSVIKAVSAGDVVEVDRPSTTQGDLSVWWLRSRKDFAENLRVVSRWVSDLVHT